MLTPDRAVEGAVGLPVPSGIWENGAEQGFGRFAGDQPGFSNPRACVGRTLRRLRDLGL